ncbi:MAG: hypothetical protein JNJ90_10210 [Saprospiraceae bacterium]|nr:hypothetical protein [Saprospiraceae bacterium]
MPGKALGSLSDMNGAFTLILEERNQNDTVIVQNPGFDTGMIPVSSLRQKGIVLLRHKIIPLPEVVITAERKQAALEMGITDVPVQPATYGMSTWMQVAGYFENPQKDSGQIVGVSFFVPKTQKTRTPFRVRIYGCDAAGKPSEDLLHDDVILQASRGDEWVFADIGKYGIRLPETGYFVAMEWINAGEKYRYHEKIMGERRDFYGQKLGAALGRETPNTWIKFIGGAWKRDDKVLGGSKSGYRNALIKSKILLLP